MSTATATALVSATAEDYWASIADLRASVAVMLAVAPEQVAVSVSGRRGAVSSLRIVIEVAQ